MVKYLESMRNYFYKQYKNGKKKRISFESYNLVMKGGEHGGPAESGDKKYNLRNSKDYQEFIEFVQREFTSTNGNNKRNYNFVKTQIYEQLESSKNRMNKQIFYIYNNSTHQIISIGIIDNHNDFVINDKTYKHIEYLLKRPNIKKAGTTSIYHILENLDQQYTGIYLYSLSGSRGFYNSLNFVEFNDSRYYLDRDQIVSLIKNSIKNTEFISI
jgi:hypothetical protein